MFLSDSDRADGTCTITDDNGEMITTLVDPRARTQRDYDVFRGFFLAGVRTGHTGTTTDNGTPKLRPIPTVNVTITWQEFHTGTGTGRLDDASRDDARDRALQIRATDVTERRACSRGDGYREGMAHELGGDGFLRAAYDRALADRAFLDTVEGSYTGEYRTIDALWWVAHPGQPTPEGIPAPSSKLRAAEAAAYSSDGSDSLHGKNVAILAELQDHLAAERSAIDKAIRRATGARVDGATSARADETTSPLATGATSALGSGAATDVTGAPLGDATDTDAGADAVPTAGENLSATIKQGQSPANRGWRAVTAALACAVVALIAIDLIRLSTDSATPSPSPNTSVLGLEALKIFSRDPLPSDDSGIQKALAVFHGDFVESSVRQLTYRVQDVLFFAALDPKGLVCFVALDGDAYLSTCTRDSAFLYAPLRLTFTTTVNFPSPATDSFTEAPALVTAEWSPDGTSQGTVERR